MTDHREPDPEYDGQWCTSKMECAICNAEWVAVYPIVAPKLECPTCGFMNEKPHDVQAVDGDPRSWD